MSAVPVLQGGLEKSGGLGRVLGLLLLAEFCSRKPIFWSQIFRSGHGSAVTQGPSTGCHLPQSSAGVEPPFSEWSFPAHASILEICPISLSRKSELLSSSVMTNPLAACLVPVRQLSSRLFSLVLPSQPYQG